MIHKITKYPKLLFSVSFFLFLLLVRSISKGVFLDGLTFGMFARNIAVGKASFWNLYFTDTVPAFKDHPPLAMWLQSFVFRIFGNIEHVEFLYSLALGLITIYLIHKIWIIFSEFIGFKNRDTSYIAIFVFSLIPLVPWAYTNNILENTMLVFILISFYFLIKTAINHKYKSIILYSVLSGFFLFLALFSKGLQCLFITIIPFLLMVFYYKNFKINKFLISSIIIISTLTLSIYVLYLSNEQGFMSFWNHYLHAQLFSTLQGTREKVLDKTFILKRIISELALPLVACLVLLLISKIRKIKTCLFNKELVRASLFFLIIGLSASLPFALSTRQKWWYILPSIPFYSISIAFMFLNIFEEIKLSKSFLYLSCVFIFLGLFTLIFLNGKLVVRDKEFNEDIVLKSFPKPINQIVQACPAKLAEDWGIVPILYRYYYISLSTEAQKYSLVDLSKQGCELITNKCKLINTEAKKYAFYDCKD